MNRKLWLVVDALLLYLIFVQVAYGQAQALPTVAPETNWTWIGIAVGCVFLIAFGIWFMRDRPGAVAKAKEDASGSFESIAHQLSEALHKLTDTHAEAVAAIPVALAATPPGAVTQEQTIDIVVVGKAGTPGTFTATVTGDPKVDIPALTAQYLG